MKPDLAEFLENNKMSGPRAYVVAALGMAVATALRVALNPYLGDSGPYTLHALVLLLVTSLGGYGPGFFSLALALGFGWSSIPPYDQPLSEKIADDVATAIAGAMICVVTAAMRVSILEAAEARRKADFLSLEMHHRVKNLFAVVASMITLSAREQPEARAALTDLRSRLQALAKAHDVAIDSTDCISFPELVERLMAPHSGHGASHSRTQFAGEPVRLPSEYMTPIGLIINELCTNAAKYGALATQNGTVRMSWNRRGDMLDINWAEFGTDLADLPPDPAPGFGSLLVEASVAQLRGKINRDLTVDGLRVHLSIPFPAKARKQFRSGDAKATEVACNPQKPSLSARRGSKRFFRGRPQIRDSRS